AGWESVARQEAVHVRGRGVARRAGVDHQDPAPGSGQDQGRGQPGCATTDDYCVVLTHARKAAAAPAVRQRTLLLLGTGSVMSPVDATGPDGETNAGLAVALDKVAPR